MSARIFYLLIFLFLPPSALAQFQNLLHKPFARRYVSLDSTFYANKAMRLDSAVMFRKLDKLTALAKANEDLELEMEARLIRYFYYLVGHQQDHKKGEAGLLALRTEADEKEIKQLQIRTRDKLAHYYFHVVHKYGPAFENYLASYELLKDVPASAFPEKQEIIANIGSAYFNFGDNQNARKYFAIAQKNLPSYKKRFAINIQNTLGLIYRTEGDHKQAEKYFRKAYAMAEANQDSVWMGIASGNIGISYFQQNRFDEALPLLETDVRQSTLAHEMDNALSSLIVIMKIKAGRGKWDEVAERFKLADKLLPLTGSPEMHQRELFSLQSKLHAISGNFQQAYRYADSAAKLRDTLYHRRNTVLLTRLEQKAEIEKHQDQVQALEANKRFQSLLLYSLIVVLVLLLIIGVLILNRQRLVYRQRQQLLRAEKDSIAYELHQASVKLNDYTRQMREKRKLIEQFTAELELFKTQNSSNASSEHEQAINRLQQATILTDEQWEEFREIFETVHHGYLQRLKNKVPGLSPAETRFMVLSKLQLNNKEMAAMLGVSTEAIRQTRHRLRKKLEATLNIDIEELSSSI